MVNRSYTRCIGIGQLFGLLLSTSVCLLPGLAHSQQTLRSTAEAELPPKVSAAVDAVNQSFRSNDGLALSERQKSEIQRIAGPTNGGSLGRLGEKREQILGVLSAEQASAFQEWERQSSRTLAAADVDDGTEGPGTFILCVLICQSLCEGDNCNCSYCAIALGVPDP